MVMELSSKGHGKVKGVKFSAMSDFYEWHVKMFLLTCTLQNVYFYVIWTFNFEIITSCLNLDRHCSGKSTHVHNGDSEN